MKGDRCESIIGVQVEPAIVDSLMDKTGTLFVDFEELRVACPLARIGWYFANCCYDYCEEHSPM